MSNSNTPFGLRPISMSGMPYTGELLLCRIPTGDASNRFIGDPLVPLGTSDANGVPDVGIATAGAAATILGAFVSIANGPALGGGAASPITFNSNTWRTASVATYVLVSHNANQLYVVQEDSLPLSTGFIAAANGGFTNVNLIAGAGSTVTGMSGWMLDSSTDDGNANPTFQMRIMGLHRAPDNAIGNYAKWVCRINLPAESAVGGY